MRKECWIAQRRSEALLALTVTVALGILSRRVPLHWHWWDKSLGDALYAAAVYLGLAIWFPRRPGRVLAGLALLICFAVELFQLSGIPAAHRHLAVVRWLIGARFSWHDLICYLAGVLTVAFLDRLRTQRANAYT